MAPSVTFLWGSAAAVCQVFIMRDYLVAAGGNELVIGFFLSSWLIGIAAGAVSAGRLTAGRAVSAGAALNLAAAFLAVSAIVVARTAHSLFSSPPGTRFSISQCAVLAVVSVLPFSTLTGALFPVSSTLFSGTGTRNPAGTAYWIEGAGMAAGSLLATFVLVPFVNPVTAVLLAFAPSGAILALYRPNDGPFRAAVSLAGCGLTVFLALAGPGRALDILTESMRFDSLKTGFNRVASTGTAYARYDLAESGGEYALFTDGQYTVSFPDVYSNAPKAHLFITEARSPARVLLIGSASFGLVPHMLKHDVAALDYVETDPLLLPFLEAASGKRLLSDDGRVRMSSDDGRAFVRRAPRGRYDLIVCDTPDPSTVALNRFYTAEFFQDAAAALSDTGVFVIGVGTDATWLGDAGASQAGAVYSALKSVFGTVLPAAGDKVYLLAARPGASLSESRSELERRYGKSGAVDTDFVPETLGSFFPEGKAAGLARRFAEASGFKPNTDRRPASYFYNMAIWDRISGGGVPGLLESFPKTGATGAAALILATFLAVIAVTVLMKRRMEAATATVLAAAGFFGIGAEVICLMEFQNSVGALYSQVGLLLAAYMAGMTGGAAAGQRIDMKGAVGAGVGIISCAAFSALLPTVLFHIPRGWGFWTVASITAVTALGGALSGFVFPMASRTLIQDGAQPAGYAGAADAMDSIGAASGALVTAVFFLPVFGIAGASMLMALSCALPGLWILAARRKC